MIKYFCIFLFIFSGFSLTAQDTLFKIQNQNFSDYKGLSSYSKDVEQNIKRQHAFAIAGIPCFAGGLLTLAAAFSMSTAVSVNNDDNLARTGAMIGGTLIAVGISFEIVSILNGIKKKKRLKSHNTN